MMSYPFRVLLLTTWVMLVGSVPAAAREARNVVVVTIDTLRADHLACYGYNRIRTPNIDQLARTGVRFASALTPVPITLPAHTALMTGQYPMATGMRDFSGNELASGAMTLARVLQRHGYSTAAFIGSAALDSRFGLNQGFDTYYDHFNLGHSREIHLFRLRASGKRRKVRRKAAGAGANSILCMPFELNDNLKAVDELYRYAIHIAGVTPAYASQLSDAGILICPPPPARATLYVLAWESFQESVSFRDSASGKEFRGRLEPGRAALMLVSHERELLASYNWPSAP